MPKTYAMSPSKSNAQTSDFNVWMMEAINVLSECSFWRNDITNRNTCGIHGFMTGLCVCVCVCVRPCMYLCVRVQIHSLCVSAAIHTYEDTKDSAHVQEASSEEPTHNGYRISLYTFAAYRFAGFNSESRPGFAIDRSDSIVFSDMRLAKDCYT